MNVIFINPILCVQSHWFGLISYFKGVKDRPLIRSPHDGFSIYCLEKYLILMELP